ncbi:hypothetical protein ACFFJI_02765 [Allobacillus sp. GCM10007491]|uniref:Uncharacterized protein n=1 Tax=Allobacillus saliphilus TaxID=2912308 RepID=A0A941CUD3_9BACI|nr:MULTISPECIES: hypothetical protein [Allobacillus]MBR7553379.1 hypothetical protein [Allobacillus saliphilus]
MKCPNCHTCNIGMIGEERFYCWNCLVEIDHEQQSRELVSQVQQPEYFLEDLFSDER